jgi:uncharacterized protein (TIGR03435 family)
MLKGKTMIVAKWFVRIGGACFMLAAGGAFGAEFEVASIKPAQPVTAQFSSGKIHIGMQVDGARVDIGSMSLAGLLPLAFKVKQYQIAGPAWLSADIVSAERFDIMGKMPDGATQDQVPEMLQALLADRFKLTFHRETREHAVYALMEAKGGSKLKESGPEPEVPTGGDDAKNGIAVNTSDGPVRDTQDGKGGIVTRGGRGGTTRITPGADGSMHMEASRVTMAQLADTLSRFVDRPVVDRTELKGDYQVTLELSMADLMSVARAAGLRGVPQSGAATASAADAASDPSSGSVFTAVQKLGLKLEPRKAPLETIVIDHLEKTPTEN